MIVQAEERRKLADKNFLSISSTHQTLGNFKNSNLLSGVPLTSGNPNDYKLQVSYKFLIIRGSTKHQHGSP